LRNLVDIQSSELKSALQNHQLQIQHLRDNFVSGGVGAVSQKENVCPSYSSVTIGADYPSENCTASVTHPVRGSDNVSVHVTPTRVSASVPKNTILMGDSILKGLGSYVNNNITVFTYPGTTVRNMCSIVSRFPSQETNVGSIMLHTGSNDLKLPVEEIVRSVRKLLLTASTTFPGKQILFSGPLYRRDSDIGKVKTLNRALSLLCKDLNVPFCDANFKIGENYLSKGGIHLTNQAKCRFFDILVDFCKSECKPCSTVPATENMQGQKNA
jgi:hypothetical protein